MTLQDIHKEFDEKFGTLPNKDAFVSNYKDREFCTMCGHPCGADVELKRIKDFYDKKIVELIKDSMPNRRLLLGSIEENDIWRTGFNFCREQLIENLKARNINLDQYGNETTIR